MKAATMLVALVLSATLVLAQPPEASGQAVVSVQVCKDVKVVDLGFSGTRADPLGCAREFSTSLPYLILFVKIAGVDYDFTYSWELIEPSGEVFAKYRVRATPTPGYRVTYSIWDVLPVGATGKEIADQNPQLGRHLVEVGAIPVSQKPGEWTIRATMTPGTTVTYRFTLGP